MASTGTRAVFLHPAEGLHGDLGMVDPSDIVIAIGKSGESVEVLQLIPALKQMGARIIAITARPDSTLGKASDIVLYTPVSREACPYDLAPTASTTSALAVGDALALTLMKLRNFKPQDFMRLHPGGALGRLLSLRVEEVMIPASKVPTLSLESATIDSVMLALSEASLGVVFFASENKSPSSKNSWGPLAGIFTDGDLRRLLLKNQKTLLEEPLRSQPKLWVNLKPTSVSPQMMAHEALEVMEKRDRPLNLLPVVGSSGEPLGILRLHELLKIN